MCFNSGSVVNKFSSVFLYFVTIDYCVGFIIENGHPDARRFDSLLSYVDDDDGDDDDDDCDDDADDEVEKIV